ncbi:hypothetical protein D1007_31660 [Hordeum vulgare]|nr:hypothetical protein D1007_31660 [Hordeum vulgare]
MDQSSWVVACDPGLSMEEAAAGWSSDHRISFQTSLPSHSDSVQLQVVEYAAPATHDTCSDPIQVFEEAVEAFHTDYLHNMERKMHKFPPSLIDVFPRYYSPATVAIGPYHHGHPDMLEAERVKHVAATQCIRDSGRPVQEMYDAVVSVSSDARSLYHHDVVARFGDDDFFPMMFFDACFLVQFMRWYHVDDDDLDQALVIYFYANFERISTDILMLENQIPWVVVETMFRFMPPAPSPWPWEMFVDGMRRNLKNRMNSGAVQDIIIDHTYEPPHLLGLVRFYIVGNKDNKNIEPLASAVDKPMSLSISVAELADVGITVVPQPREKIEAGLVDMGFHKKYPFFGVLVVPPLCLTEANATWLVNMAAFELCKTPEFEDDDTGAEKSDVCSYLQLFTMLLDQEKHVHELRENHVIEGGGLTSKETLEFFTSIGQNMQVGKSYLDIIIQIENFKQSRSCWQKSWIFSNKNRNKIMAVISAIGVVIGILSSLQAFKPR